MRGLDRIDVADHVGDRHVGRGQLLDVARVARQPGDRHASSPSAATAARGRPQIGASGSSLISQPGTTGIASSSSEVSARRMRRLRLAAQAEQDEVVARQDRVDDLRDDRVVVADDAGEQRLAGRSLRIRLSRTSSLTLRRGAAPPRDRL